MREYGLVGNLKAVWFYWRLLHGHCAKLRRSTYREQRDRGSNAVGAFCYAFMKSRLITWPRPLLINAVQHGWK